MRKINANSIWNSLSPERRKEFEHWLFEERVSYREAQERAQREWNVTGSLMSISRFYHRIEKERMLGDMAEALESSKEVEQAPAQVKGLWQAGLKVVALQFFEKAMGRGDVKELSALGRLVSDHEQRELQRERLCLARERFEFNAARAAWAQMPLMNKFRAADNAREDRKIAILHRAIFGKEDDVKESKVVTACNAA